MAYYMFRTQIISKSNQSAVASSAYRSGETLYSERDGLTKDYKERDVLPETYILSPSHAPEWANDREKLWNEVENIEKQHNAQLSREIVMALPSELSEDEQTSLTLDFCKENFSDKGMVADISIHRDKQHNPHAHVMLTLRPFNEDGTWGNKRKKVNGKSVHLTNWNEKKTMVEWRKNFADKINEKFREHGIEDRVSHESFEKQGLDKIPQIRMSRESYQFEQKQKDKAKEQGKDYEPSTYYGKINQEIQEINKELSAYKENQNVVSLEEKKSEKEIDKNIDHIRQNASLSESEKTALTMVAKRAKTYVDYPIASKVFNEIAHGNWNKKLEKQQLQIQAEKNLINKVHHTFKENPKNVIQYGFSPKEYKTQISDRIQNLKEMETSYKDEHQKYEATLKKAELALHVQKDFVSQEFNQLYTDTTQDFTPEEMHGAVQHFKDTGQILPESDIKQRVQEHESNNRTVPTIVDQTRNISKSLFILDRALQKQKNVRLESLRNRDFSSVYEASRKIEQYSLRKDTLSKELKENTALLKTDLQKHYGHSSLQRMSSHPETIIRLQKMNQEGKGSGNLEKDIKQLQKQQSKEASNTQAQTPQQQVEKDYMTHVADGMLQSLYAIQHANEENKYRDSEGKPKRKRGRHQKDNDLEL